jgi:hypothetical protein
MGFFVSYHGVFVYMWRAAIFLHVSDASTLIYGSMIKKGVVRQHDSQVFSEI